MQFNHKFWIEQALNIARQVKDEIPVCALIVKENELIAKTVNQTEKSHDSTSHAEILAIREASSKLRNWRLNDCYLYTTLEPCTMCTGAIINSRISKVIFGAYDLDYGACGSVINLFCDLNKLKQIEIIGGILEVECSELLKSFFALKRK